MPGLSVDFLWDRDAERAVDAARAFGLRATLSIATEAIPDGFLILSETCHHRADVSGALRARRPIFLEKPLARGRSEAVAVSRLIHESGVAFHTGFFLRSVPAFGRLRELVRAGRLGTVGMVGKRFSHDGVRAGWRDGAAWLTRRETAGYGGFGDLAIHAVALLAWLGLGPLEPRAVELVNVRRRATEARLVPLREARAANLLIDDLYQLRERTGAAEGTSSAELPVPSAGDSSADS